MAESTTYDDPRRYSWADRLLDLVDAGVKTVFGPAPLPVRRTPGGELTKDALGGDERRLAAALMRVNHSGEVCAQALYQAQALTARSAETREAMRLAAAEENDHLAWCEQRIRQLDGHVSYLNPLWYAGSCVIGGIAGIAGDNWNLGFVAETERQVVRHLENHLERLPDTDGKSRAIVAQMREDEGRHATKAVEAGAADLPPAVKALMAVHARVMTTVAFWL